MKVDLNEKSIKLQIQIFLGLVLYILDFFCGLAFY